MSLPTFILPESPAHARQMQDMLRQQIHTQDSFDVVKTIGGVDVGYDNERGLAHASIVTMSIDDLKPIEQYQCFIPVDFPYIPGLLAFREIPAILAVLNKIKNLPDVLMVDGQGIAHPRRMGIAAHLGVLLNRPTIGVAKSRLTGTYEMPAMKKGSQSPLMAAHEQIGVVLRSKDNVNPLFISPGHLVSMQTALDLTLRCLTRYRLPEPTRMADKLSKCSNKNQTQLAI